MKWFARLLSRVQAALRRRRHSRLPEPIPRPLSPQISATQIHLPPTNTDTSVTVLEAPVRAAADEEQSQLLPPITRTSESVWEAPIRASTDEERDEETVKKLQLLIPPVQTVSVDLLSAGGWSRSSRGTSTSSQASTSRSSSRSKASTEGNSLNAKLRRNRIDYAQSFFIPICAQNSLITIPNIEKGIRDGDDILSSTEIQKIAIEAIAVAPKLFAILACLGKGPKIRFLLKEGVSDNDLPLECTRNKNGSFELQRTSGKVITAFETWSDFHIEEFGRIQWWMIAPVFEDKQHYELEDSTVLPFIPFVSSLNTERKEGGYSEVFAARIHPSHHNFWPHSELEENEPLVAIKKLFSSNKTEFQKEVAMLKALDSKNHPHLITLLTTFKHQRKYHLVFRYANANLRQYWKDRPLVAFNKKTVLWSLKQMTGMAHALESIHNFSMQYPLGVDGKVHLRRHAKPSTCKEEERFGRHGDIKPENVLWFQQSSESKDENGSLQLADFGMGRFHSRRSRSNVPCDEAIGSPTYEPPECKLRRPVSRAYDIWSIGCLYLEFITWLLHGSAAIAGLSDAEGKTTTSTATRDNHFFTIVGGIPVVREEVVVWVQRLHEHEKCSALIHELLAIVMKDLLHPEAAMRAQSRWLFHRLDKCLDRAAKEEDYLLKPVPWPQKPNDPLRSKTASIVDGTPRERPKGAAFENKEKLGPSSGARFKPAKDLLGRNAGTPGFLKRSRTDVI